MLHISLPLPCGTHVIVMFGEYESPQPVLLGKPLDKARAMFPGTSGEVVCYTDTQRAVRPIRNDVHPSRHPQISFERRLDHNCSWMAGTRPAMNDKMGPKG